jgi:hypothetical protein
MRKLLSLLAALLVMFGIAGIGGAASAAPGTRVSVRTAVSSECVATVYVTWSHADPRFLPTRLNVSVKGENDGYEYGINNTLVETEKGKMTFIFTLTPRVEGKQDLVTTATLIGYPLVTNTKAAACEYDPNG